MPGSTHCWVNETGSDLGKDAPDFTEEVKQLKQTYNKLKPSAYHYKIRASITSIENVIAGKPIGGIILGI